jgi:hypothetical protein
MTFLLGAFLGFAVGFFFAAALALSKVLQHNAGLSRRQNDDEEKNTGE